MLLSTDIDTTDIFSDQCIICYESTNSLLSGRLTSIDYYINKPCKCKYKVHEKCIIDWYSRVLEGEECCIYCNTKAKLKPPQLRLPFNFSISKDLCNAIVWYSFLITILLLLFYIHIFLKK